MNIIRYSVYGATREEIETQAAKTAADYFGDTPHRIKIGTVEPHRTLSNGEVTVWVAPGVQARDNTPPPPPPFRSQPEPEPRGSSGWCDPESKRPSRRGF